MQGGSVSVREGALELASSNVAVSARLTLEGLICRILERG